MKNFTLLLLSMAPLTITSPLYAVMYPFPEREPAYANEAVREAGTKLYLFHGGTADMKTAIKVNDVLDVYGEYPFGGSPKARTGKVKVLSVLGEYYYEAEVIAGTVQAGYLARKGAVACCVICFKNKN
jgi:hypothetical protein